MESQTPREPRATTNASQPPTDQPLPRPPTGASATSAAPGKIVPDAPHNLLTRLGPDNPGAEALRADGRPALAKRQAVVVPMEKVASERVEWLWPGRIALGKLTLVVGDPDLGKSLLTVDLAARVSGGKRWPDDPECCAPQGEVLLLNAEDGLEDTLRPRLDAAGADPRRMQALTGVKDPQHGTCEFSLATDLPLLAELLDHRPETRLIVIDPISAYLGGQSGNINAQVRSLLWPLAKLAQERRVAVVAVTHLNKDNGGPAMYRAMGSLAFAAAARAAWGVVEDPADAGRRLFLPIKNNLSRRTKGLAFRTLHDPNGAGQVDWFPEPLETTLAEVLQPRSFAASPASPESTAIQSWLAGVLADGPLDANVIYKLAQQDGITVSQVRKAASALRVSHDKKSFLDGWLWSLPKQK